MSPGKCTLSCALVAGNTLQARTTTFDMNVLISRSDVKVAKSTLKAGGGYVIATRNGTPAKRTMVLLMQVDLQYANSVNHKEVPKRGQISSRSLMISLMMTSRWKARRLERFMKGMVAVKGLPHPYII